MTLGRAADALPARLSIPLRARFGHKDPEIKHLYRFVRRGDTVIDVGAHKGAYAWHLARLVGAPGRVHAFEPQPELARRLAKALPDQVIVHPYALSSDASIAKLTIPLWGSTRMLGHASLELIETSDSESLNVEALTLDSLGIEEVAFIKADIEGHELAMLLGAENTISRFHPPLLLEIDYRHTQEVQRRGPLLRWLQDHGYSATYLDRGQLRPAGQLTAATDPNGMLGTTEYIYNWFFQLGD